MPPSPRQFDEQAEDILGFVVACQSEGKACALGVITDVSGGSSRSAGTIVAVSETGEMAGYVSNGCVDADLRLQALEALERGQPRHVIYGVGSPFIDLRLPCGGTIKIAIDPAPDPRMCRQALATLHARQPASLVFARNRGFTGLQGRAGDTGWQGELFHALHLPRMRLTIAGTGAPAAAVVRVALAMDVPLTLFSPEPTDEAHAAPNSQVSFRHLTSPRVAPELHLDAWSGLLLLFHAHEWETQFLAQALRATPFFIGALGSQRTHAARLDNLRDLGFSERDLLGVQGPVGVIQSARDANTLAISVMAEIVLAYREKPKATRQKRRGPSTLLPISGAA